MKNKAKSKKPDLRKLSSLRLPTDYPWKVLGWLTEDLCEYLTESEYTHITSIIRNRDMIGYMQLSEDNWGIQCIRPDSDISLNKVRVKYLLAALLKKYQFGSDKESRLKTAMDKFIATEKACSSYNHSGYLNLVNPKEDWMVDVYSYAKTFLKKLLGETLPGKEILSRWSRHGPGASLDTCKGNTSAYHKYSEWPYSCTQSAFRYARFLIETDQRWYGALIESYRMRKNIPMHSLLDMKRFWIDVVKVVDGNRITFVPKDARTERSIAIEPTLNLFLQLGVDGFFRRRLKRWGVDLDNQSKNQELARLGSMSDNDDSYVTIDLASASDSISLKLCQVLLPEDWYNYLVDLRSPVGLLGDDTISYEKISSMGNGYTFALESAIFTAVVYGVIRETSGKVSKSDFAVYGDDLIVRKHIIPKLIPALANCGFTINSDKSFLNGPVRESCGADWFQGKPIRPVFFKDLPSNVMELFTDINRLDRLLSLRWWLEDSKVVTQMEKWIPEGFKTLTGPLSDEDFDSYRHARHHNGRHSHCLWKYKRLIIKPLPQKGREFHMRKLMASLSGESFIKPTWQDKRLTGAGSRFTVTSRNAFTVRYTYSVSDFWRSMYSESLPPLAGT